MNKQQLIKLLSSFLLLFLLTSAQAQEGKNPFDLSNRKVISVETPAETVEESTEALVPTPVDEQTEVDLPVENTPDNPFNLKRANSLNKPTEPSLSNTTSSTETKLKTPVVEQIKPPLEGLSGSFKFWMITTLLILLTLSVTLYNSNISKVYRAFLNNNFLKMIQRENTFPYFLLYGLFFISGGIFVFQLANYYGVRLSNSRSLDLFLYIGIVTALFLLKHLVLNIFSYIFPITKDIRQYSFTIVIFGIALGLLLIPANVLIAFAPLGMTKPLIYGTFVVILLLYLFRILRSLFIASRYISLHKFHFFMYLCTVEIAPMLVLIKIILLKTG